MIDRFHSLRRDEEGQSLVIACVAVLILALGVMTTVNLGRAIHTRIGVQQTADAAAYSMAVMEARTFNFYAFTNRAQIVHYVSAMCVQSIISFSTFIVALVTEFIAMLKTLDVCNPPDNICKIAICAALDVLTAGAASEFSEIVQELAQLVQELNQALDALDQFLGEVIVPLLQMLNRVMYGFAKLYGEAMVTGIATGAQDIVQRNDDQINMGTSQLVVGALNARLFDNAHQQEAGGKMTPLGGGSLVPSLPDNTYNSSNGALQQAKRAMSEVANASRHTDPENFLTDRGLDGLPIPGASIFATLVSPFLIKYGQTKLTSVPLPDHNGGWKNCIHTTGVDHGQVTQGNVLAADDLFVIDVPLLSDIPRIGKYLQWGEDKDTMKQVKPNNNEPKAFIVSVWADKYRGEHFRPNPNNPWKKKSFPPFPLSLICSIDVFRTNYLTGNASKDQHHPWDGLTPFMQFDITGSQGGKGQEVFYNQPSTWSLVQKNYAQSKKDSASGPDTLKPTERNNLTVATPEGPSQIDTTNQADVFPPFANKSYNALSRAMVYYHRARNWEEPPNFFNPYWHAKLDPVVVGLPQVGKAVPGGGNALSSLATKVSGPLEKVLVH